MTNSSVFAFISNKQVFVSSSTRITAKGSRIRFQSTCCFTLTNASHIVEGVGGLAVYSSDRWMWTSVRVQSTIICPQNADFTDTFTSYFLGFTPTDNN